MTDVDPVTTVWERTYRSGLAAGWLDSVAAETGYPFTSRTVVINNVTDTAEAVRMAEQRLRAGELSRYVLVQDHLADALALTRPRRLGRLAHYTDHFLVAVTAGGADLMVFWDTDVRLTTRSDWITPSVDLMRRRLDVGVALPFWGDRQQLERERWTADGDFSLLFGFSDQCWMSRRSLLARPVYDRFAPAGWRYHTAPVARTFEQRIDAFLRTERLFSAAHMPTIYTHAERMAHDPTRTPVERARRKMLRAGVQLTRRMPPWPRVNTRPPSSV